MLLYIHVPFCRGKCAYCAFYSQVLPAGGEGATAIQDYLATLLQELRLWSERLLDREIRTIFFGGGTPSLLPAKAVAGILDQIGKRFKVSGSAEISIEANPESALTDGWLFDVRKAGVNRLSLGVQSFDDRALTLLGRRHDARCAQAAFAAARHAGFTNISLDFMWGLPGASRGQAQREWLADLRRAVELKPEHISAYGLTVEAGSALENAHAAGDLSLPVEEALGSMYLSGGEYLEENGYIQYEISNFARLGQACRHNLGYWQGEEYLGLGPSATSTIDGKRWTNTADVRQWRGDVARGRLGTAPEILDPLSALKEHLMLRLRLSKGLALQEWLKRSGRSFLKEFGDLVPALQENGLAGIRDGHFRLTRPGMLVSDAILAHFFARLERERL